jgi:hypothetical protein
LVTNYLDKSEGGWKTVEEYISDEVASHSEDEKRIRAADNRAVRKIKSVRKDGCMFLTGKTNQHLLPLQCIYYSVL